MTDSPSPTESRLQALAGLFALLFLISGAEGQVVVQFTFLLLCAASLLLGAQWPACQRAWRGFRRSHPQFSRELNLLLFRWYWRA